MQVGFIGLGNLGMAIAKRLLSQGINLTVWNRTKEKAEALGCPVAKNPAELIAKCDLLFLCLLDSSAVEMVLLDDEGLIHGNCQGKIVIDITTNHPVKVMEFYKILGERGGIYLEAPVLGSVTPALQGLLTVLVSGDRKAFERAKPVLEIIGKNIYYLEKPQLATQMKLINNLVLGAFMATLAEAIVFGEKIGIEKDKVIEILLSGAGNSAILIAKKEKLLKEDFSPHFSCSLIYKDLHYLQELAWIKKNPLFIGSLAKELFALTFAEGVDKEDFAAIYKVFKGMRK